MISSDYLSLFSPSLNIALDKRRLEL